MPQIHQKLMKNNWIKVTKGSFPLTSMPMVPGGCRLRIRYGGKGIAHTMGETQPGETMTFNTPIIVREGDHYKVELKHLRRGV